MQVPAPKPVPGPEEVRRRARAIYAYSQLTYPQLEALLGEEPRFLEARLADKARSKVTIELALRIADACGVPRSFITDGWAMDVSERLTALETQMRASRRFADQAQEGGQQQGGHPESDDEDPPGEDSGDPPR